MISLVTTVVVLVIVFFVQKQNPFLAGLLAVIPVKIIGTALMTMESGGKESLMIATKGMLIGQFVWGFVLLIGYLVLKRVV